MWILTIVIRNIILLNGEYGVQFDVSGLTDKIKKNVEFLHFYEIQVVVNRDICCLEFLVKSRRRVKTVAFRIQHAALTDVICSLLTL